jgi:hypothetical protein
MTTVCTVLPYTDSSCTKYLVSIRCAAVFCCLHHWQADQLLSEKEFEIQQLKIDNDDLNLAVADLKQEVTDISEDLVL